MNVLFLYAITVAYRLWWVPNRAWRWPLKNGERYFYDIEVPEGWHSSAEGKKWWRRYRATIIGPLVLEALAFAWIALWGTWDQLPVLALMAPVTVATSWAFLFWWRHANRAALRPPKRVAVTLQERKLSTYFSWRIELLLIVLLAASWAVLAVRGDSAIEWRMPITTTYVVLGLAAMKVVAVRQGWALPVDRAAEYERWYEFRRKYGAIVLDRTRWFWLAILVGYAAVHSAGGIAPVEPVRWAAFALAIGLFFWMMTGIVRGQSEYLRGSAAAVLPPATSIFGSRTGWKAFGVFIAGLAILMIWPWR